MLRGLDFCIGHVSILLNEWKILDILMCCLSILKQYHLLINFRFFYLLIPTHLFILLLFLSSIWSNCILLIKCSLLFKFKFIYIFLHLITLVIMFSACNNHIFFILGIILFINILNIPFLWLIALFYLIFNFFFLNLFINIDWHHAGIFVFYNRLFFISFLIDIVRLILYLIII